MNLSPECERRRIGVAFLVETAPSPCKCGGELLGSGMQSRVIPFQQLMYWKTPVNTGWPRSQKWPWTLSRAWALKSPRSVQFSSSLWLFRCVLLMAFHHPLSPCSCRALVHCWAEAGAETSVGPELLISRLLGLVSFHAYFLALIGTTWYWRTNWGGLVENLFFFFFFLLYPVIQLVTCFLFNIFLVGWIRSAELCLAELTAGIRVFYHCPPPPCLSNRFMQSYVSRLRTSDNWPYKAY